MTRQYNENHEFTKIMLAKNGRYAVLARMDKEDPWTQVESIRTECLAIEYAADLENIDTERQEALEDYEPGEMWENDDAPEGTPADGT